MLSFQVVDSGNGIQVMCDEAGLATLEDAIARLRRNGGHLHLRTSKNGGRELDAETPFGEKAVGEVVFTSGGG